MLAAGGGLVIHAHPFREVKHEIVLYPRAVHGVEVYNSSRTEFENRLAAEYCENYGLVRFAGSDNHIAHKQKRFGGMATDTPLSSVRDFINRVLSGEAKPFARDENGVTLL